MPDGEEGHLLVPGPQVFKSYLNTPEATAATFHGDWFRTGDAGVMEEDGFVRLVARIKGIIITGGFNVYPAEVEEAMSDHRHTESIDDVGRPREDGAEDVAHRVPLRDASPLARAGLHRFRRR